jgi:catechol 2,3-dioxygenase-like lactoylglutathione lyase family enzyme
VLSERPCYPTLPASDLNRARTFYREKLGLEPTQETPAALFYTGGEGSRFILFPSQGKASGSHTQIGWQVPDIHAEVAQLKARGVVFEEYDFPGLKTVNSVAETGPVKAAWFKDSEGNLLGLAQME